MAMSDADCRQRSKLNRIASISKSSRKFDQEESQERIGRSDTRSVKKEMAKPGMAICQN